MRLKADSILGQNEVALKDEFRFSFGWMMIKARATDQQINISLIYEIAGQLSQDVIV